MAQCDPTERLGLSIPYAWWPALSFTPMILRTMAKRISSPAVGLCLDVGHANVVAGLVGTTRSS